MTRDKSIKNRELDSPRQRKVTLSDKRRGMQLKGYQNIADIMFNGGETPKR